MGNVSKRQQPDQIKNNSRGSPTGLQCSEKFPNMLVMSFITLNRPINRPSFIHPTQ